MSNHDERSSRAGNDVREGWERLAKRSRGVVAGVLLLTGVELLLAGGAPAWAGRAVHAPERSPYPGRSMDPRGDWDRDAIINGMDPDDDNDGIPDFEDPEPYSRMPASGGARKPEPDPL